MNASRLVRALVSVVCLSLAILFIGGCSDSPQDRFQGYVEGEFVYVASPLAGQLDSLQVRRGDQVKTGDPLFALDETAEKAALDMARAALVLSEAEFTRQERLFRMGPAAAQDYDRARSTRDQDRQRVAQAEWNFNQKRRRHHWPVWFMTRFFARANGWQLENRSSYFCRRKTSKCARSFLKRRLVRSTTVIRPG
jgi:multidrug efflux pump subunit AcrA (membrane-fusion protein)